MRRAERYAGSPCPEPDRGQDQDPGLDRDPGPGGTLDPGRLPPDGQVRDGQVPDGQVPGGLPPDGQPADCTPAESRPTETPARGFSSLRPFRHRAFTLLWGAGLVSTIGSWMQTVAVGALVIS